MLLLGHKEKPWILGKQGMIWRTVNRMSVFDQSTFLKCARKGQNLTLFKCPNGGSQQVGVWEGEVRAYCAVEPLQGAQAWCPLTRRRWRQTCVWGPQGVSGPMAKGAAVLSHAELSTGRGSGRRVGWGHSLTSSLGTAF